MAQTLQNQLTYAKSMNGIITLSDGAGTTISNGIVDTDILEVEQLNATNFTSNAIIASSLQLLRTSTTAVNNLLGTVVDIGKLTQNMTFNPVLRQVQVWNDAANAQLFTIAVDANDIELNTPTGHIGLVADEIDLSGTIYLTGNIEFQNSAVSFPNSSCSFDSNLPTSILTPTLPAQLITKTYADSTFQPTGSYATLGGNNAFIGINTFNTNLPTSSLNASSGNQMVTRGYGDTRYQQIANNIIYVRNVATDNCFILGSGPATVGSGYNNFTAGGRAGEALTSGYNNFALGTVALLQCTTGAENTAIGAGALIACNGNANTAIGYCGPNVSSGSYNTFIGKFCGGGVTTQNDNCCIGYFSFVSGNGNANTCYGNYSGQSLTSGYNNVLLGFGSNVSSGTINNAVAIGAGSTAQDNYEFVLGTDNHIITIPNKTKLASCQSPIGATITLSFRTNENVILKDSTTTVINLPTPNAGDSRNVGCKFTIIRAVTSTNNITINAPAGQTIGQGQYSGTLSPAGSFLLRKGESQVSIVCIGNSGMSYMVINTSLSQATDNLFISSTIPLPAINYALTFGGVSTTDYYPQFSDTTNLNYKPSTQTLTATNISSSGTVNGNFNGNFNITDQTGIATTFYPTFVGGVSGYTGLNAGSNLQYRPDTQSLLLSSGTFEGYKSRATTFQYLTQNTLITAATTLSEPLRSYYPFTMKTAATYTITVPEITATNVGTQLVFKRIGGSLQVLNIAMSANQPAFLLTTAVGSLTAFQLVNATQSCGTMVAIQSQEAGAGTFTNAAASTTITIATQTSGTLSIGGKINLNGLDRWITAYSGGSIGGTGNYVVNSAIPTANVTAVPYTSSLTYAWSVSSVQ
jgi:hypothetical protein